MVRSCEEENGDEIVAESPTVLRDMLNIIKNIIGIKNFELHSLAIKNAFLQEEIKCEVFIKQPEQYAIPGTLWRLKKSVYGMVEAAQKWWDKISGKLTEKNCQLSRLDP